MKKIKKLPLIIIFGLCFLLLFGITELFGNKHTAYADSYNNDYLYGFQLDNYDVTYDIKSNCSISVTEDITITYLGMRSTGFIRDIPVNNGAQVRNVEVKKFDGNIEETAWYDVYSETDSDNNPYLCIDIGDPDIYKRGQSERYIINYTYNITNKTVNSGTLPLNPVGHGWGCLIKDADVKLIAPDGYLSAECYAGVLGSNTEFTDFNEVNFDGKTVITAKFEQLYGEGVTFYLHFNDGSIKSYSDYTPYWFVLAGLIILAVLILLKLFVFNKNKLMPVVNYEAPDKMDPLIMGKLIDNKVNSEDVTSLIYYWADKGYIKINLDDKDDPLLIRVMQHLPLSCPDYERFLYDSLFRSGDAVRPSQLKNSFYRVIEQTSTMVNRHAKGLYDSKSIGISVMFAVLGGLLLGFAPMILTLTTISVKMLMIAPFIALIPALVIYAASETVKYYSLKYSKQKLALLSCGIALLCCVVGLFYVLLIPTSIMGYGAKIALFIVSALIFTCSTVLISRTKNYSDKLNDILGFKNFIQLAEKAQLEMMLENDPQFYYRILPYAQVLGVTDKWEEKFKDLTVEPPQWLTGNVVTTYFEFRILNSMLRNSMGKITSGMVSRPSSSGSNGGGRGFGGGGGGFSGGGFGGGGGRGR